MILYEVCAFNEEYQKKTNVIVAQECEKYFKQILGYLKGKISYDRLFERTKDILFIIEDELTFLFTTALLFINTDNKSISEHIGVPEESIECFKEIFFRMDFLRGKIAKIGFFKRLIASSNKDKQTLGVILKAAHTFGEEYIKWKFGLTEMSVETSKIIDSTFKDMYFKYMEKSYKANEDEILEHIRTGKQIISAASDIAKATASGGSSIDDIKNYLMSLNDAQNDSNFVELEFIDLAEENFIQDEKEK